MTSALHLAAVGAAGIALLSAMFGVGVARVLWAQDLEQAQRIDAIRSRTEESLRGSIAAQERHIDLYRRQLGETR